MISRRAKTVVRTSILTSALLALALALPVMAQSGVSTSQSRELKSFLFQVALLVADRDGDSSLDDLPKNTRKAIEDIQDFLPFKSYKLLDVAVIRSNAHARGLINGPGGEDYRIDFDFHSDSDSEQLFVRSFGLQENARVPQALIDGQDTGSSYAPKPGRQLVASSFSIMPGETIVVGSSKLEGGSTALVVLLTAIP